MQAGGLNTSLLGTVGDLGWKVLEGVCQTHPELGGKHAASEGRRLSQRFGKH